jgi:hypothetical protein
MQRRLSSKRVTEKKCDEKKDEKVDTQGSCVDLDRRGREERCVKIKRKKKREYSIIFQNVRGYIRKVKNIDKEAQQMKVR